MLSLVMVELFLNIHILLHATSFVIFMVIYIVNNFVVHSVSTQKKRSIKHSRKSKKYIYMECSSHHAITSTYLRSFFFILTLPVALTVFYKRVTILKMYTCYILCRIFFFLFMSWRVFVKLLRRFYNRARQKNVLS